MDEAVDAVAGGEAFNQPFTVLVKPREKIGCHADVKRAVLAAGENVDKPLLLRLPPEPPNTELQSL